MQEGVIIVAHSEGMSSGESRGVDLGAEIGLNAGMRLLRGGTKDVVGWTKSIWPARFCGKLYSNVRTYVRPESTCSKFSKLVLRRVFAVETGTEKVSQSSNAPADFAVMLCSLNHAVTTVMVSSDGAAYAFTCGKTSGSCITFKPHNSPLHK